jgi:hypothetical protein
MGVSITKKAHTVQLLVRTNIPELNECNDAGDVHQLWADTNFTDVEVARDAWPLETYRVVEVIE